MLLRDFERTNLMDYLKLVFQEKGKDLFMKGFIHQTTHKTCHILQCIKALRVTTLGR